MGFEPEAFISDTNNVITKINNLYICTHSDKNPDKFHGTFVIKEYDQTYKANLKQI